MPIYTYRCENCGVQFERAQKYSEAPLTRCPECNKKSLRKVYTPVGIVFKGSGFYATDHRSPSGARTHGDHAAQAEKKAAEGGEDAGATAAAEKSAEGKKPASKESTAD